MTVTPLPTTLMETNPGSNRKEMVPVHNEYQVRQLKHLLTHITADVKMGTLNKTKLMTAASELVQNMLKYGGGGQVMVETIVQNDKHEGVRLTFTDDGPGIPDIDLVMQDGYSTGNTLGIGLPGTKRLVDDFFIESETGKGTTVIITKWVNG